MSMSMAFTRLPTSPKPRSASIDHCLMSSSVVLYDGQPLKPDTDTMSEYVYFRDGTLSHVFPPRVGFPALIDASVGMFGLETIGLMSGSASFENAAHSSCLAPHSLCSVVPFSAGVWDAPCTDPVAVMLSLSIVPIHSIHVVTSHVTLRSHA